MNSSDKIINGVPARDIITFLPDDEDAVERIAHRRVKPDISLTRPDPAWPKAFEAFQKRIEDALQPGGPEDGTPQVSILAVRHVGSTSVPKLPAKPVIDIDLVLSDNSLAAEAFYVPRLEAAGFQFLFREPKWYGHRFFVGVEPMFCNLHVWGPKTAEVERHRIFKEWLTTHDDDRELYAQTKEACAKAAREAGENMMQYNYRKEEVLRDILQRAFRSLGLLSD